MIDPFVARFALVCLSILLVSVFWMWAERKG